MFMLRVILIRTLVHVLLLIRMLINSPTDTDHRNTLMEERIK